MVIAKPKPNRAPLFIFVGMGSAALIAGAFWIYREQHAAPAPQAAALSVPPLPAGPLEFLSAGVSEVRYLAPEATSAAGGAVQATVLIVGKSPTAIAQRYAMVVRRETVDCTQGRIFNEMAGQYDAKGGLLNHELQSGRAGRPVEASDAEFARLCDDKPAAPRRRLAGFRAAQREVQSPPDDLFATADANPKDADTWAWVCASGAHGHWRPSMPADCDRAVSLQPKATATILDRAFLKVKIGKLPGADADFRMALGLEPQNATALFGRSLVAAMLGDMAASKRYRGLALDIDPTVPDWIQGTYMFQISREFRTR